MIASFPGPAQLSVACFMPGNKATSVIHEESVTGLDVTQSHPNTRPHRRAKDAILAELQSLAIGLLVDEVCVLRVLT